MGVLAHYLEEDGLSTTQISLIRKHSEIIKPPRALWVSFELGRPFGIPNDAAFQRRVLLACLKLLEAPKGPILEDFSEDIPATANQDDQVLVCPINFGSKPATGLSDAEQLQVAFKEEMMQLRPWHELSIKKYGRTTVGVSHIDVNALAEFLCAFLDGEVPQNPRDDITLPEVLKLATEDLRALYSESMAAQPGPPPSSAMLAEWFWDRTVAAKLLSEIQKVCLNSEDEMLQIVGKALLIPATVAAKK